MKIVKKEYLGIQPVYDTGVPTFLAANNFCFLKCISCFR
jgi:hypothetical protein